MVTWLGPFRQLCMFKDSEKFVLFDWGDRGRSEFTFDVVANDCHRFLCLELFDHSALKTHKYFRGAAYVPLEELGSDAEPEAKECRLKSLPSLGRKMLLSH